MSVPLPPSTTSAWLVAPDRAPVPSTPVPVTPVRLTLFAPPLDVIEVKALFGATANEPVASANACPLLLRMTSRTLRAPKLVPVIDAPVALPEVNPYRWLPEASTMALVPPIRVAAGAPVFMTGSGSLSGRRLKPVRSTKVCVASCPIRRWLLSRVSGPV